MVLSAICPASCARRLATKTPSGDSDCRSPGDAEHAQAAAVRCVNTELGALCDSVTDLPLATIPLRMDVVLSKMAASIASFELA